MIKKIGLTIIMILISINICFAINSTNDDLIYSIYQMDLIAENYNVINQNLDKINFKINDNDNKIDLIAENTDSIKNKFEKYNYSPVFFTIASVLGGLLAILFSITSIYIASIKDKYGILPFGIQENEQNIYIWLVIGILLNLFHFILTNLHEIMITILIIIDLIYLIIMFIVIWKQFRIIIVSINLRDVMGILYKKINKLSDDKKVENIKQLYGFIDYSIKNNIKDYEFGMKKLTKVIKSIEDNKIQRGLFSDFSDLIIKAPRRYSRDTLKLYVDIANKIKDRAIIQIENEDSEYIRTGSNLHFVTVRLKELSKELINEDSDMDRSILSYALLTDVNNANIEVIKKQEHAFYLCSSSINWALDLINRFIQNHNRLEHNGLTLIFLSLWTYFDQLKRLLPIRNLEPEVKSNILLIISKYEEYADKILNKQTPNIQDVWKKRVIKINASHFSTIEDRDIDSKISSLKIKYSNL